MIGLETINHDLKETNFRISTFINRYGLPLLTSVRCRLGHLQLKAFEIVSEMDYIIRILVTLTCFSGFNVGSTEAQNIDYKICPGMKQLI